MGKTGHRVFSTVFDRILYILAVNNDMRKSVFEIWPDSSTNYGVSCSIASKNS